MNHPDRYGASAKASAGPRPALILDRDGVINNDYGYVHRIEQCRFVDGVFDLALSFAARGFAIIITTNQAGIGRGFYTEQDFTVLMGWIEAEFARRGIAIAGVYHCPDHPTEGLGPYRRDNPWRKPGPGMLLQAAVDHDLDLARSWTIGDKPSDIEAGRAACVGTLVLYDAAAPSVARRDDYWVVPRLGDIVSLLPEG